MKLKEILTGKYLRFLIYALLIFFIGLSVSAERSTKTITSTGTGFIVSSEGYILTNEHVIHNATKITVTIDGQNYKATVVQDDPNKDLALLKVGEYGRPAVRLGDSDKVQINDQVIAIGCPDARCGTVTQGRIANLDQTATFGDKTLHNLLMIDVTITHGSSGGPLLNPKGEVIGITMGGIKGTRFGFAIPINDAISLLRQVPGFSKPQMGQATEELSFKKIKRQAGAATVFVKAVSERPLESLIPREPLGVQLEKIIVGLCDKSDDPDFPICPSCRNFREQKVPGGYTKEINTGDRLRFNLEDAGFNVQDQAQGFYKSPYYSRAKIGTSRREILITVFEFKDDNEAQRASTFFNDPTNYDNPVTTLFYPERTSQLLLTDAIAFDKGRLNLATRLFFGHRNVNLWGAANLVWDDILFVIWLVDSESIYTSDSIKEELSCTPHYNYISCSWYKRVDIYNEGKITYQTSMSPNKFLETLKTLVNTILKTTMGE